MSSLVAEQYQLRPMQIIDDLIQVGVLALITHNVTLRVGNGRQTCMSFGDPEAN